TPVLVGQKATCTVTLSNDTVESFSISATAAITFADASIGSKTIDLDYQDVVDAGGTPVIKRFSDLSIQIDPQIATNEVREAHTFTVTVLRHEISGTEVIT